MNFLQASCKFTGLIAWLVLLLCFKSYSTRIVPPAQATLVLWKLQTASASSRNLHPPYLRAQLTEAASRHSSLGSHFCRRAQEMEPEMVPCSSGSPGHGPQHLLEQLPPHIRDLKTDQASKGGHSCLGLGLLGRLGPLVEVGAAGGGLPPCPQEVGTGGGSVSTSEGAAGDQQPGQHHRY